MLYLLLLLILFVLVGILLKLCGAPVEEHLYRLYPATRCQSRHREYHVTTYFGFGADEKLCLRCRRQWSEENEFSFGGKS